MIPSAFFNLLAERLTLRGQSADPGAHLADLVVRGQGQLVAVGVADERWFSGAERLDRLAGVAAAQFGVGGDGQASGGSGGMIPFLPVGHGLGEGPFSLLVVVAHGPVGGGQGLVPRGALVGADLAGCGGFCGGADGAQVGVGRTEPG